MDPSSDVLTLLNDAVARGDWLTVGVAALAVLAGAAGAGLKLAGRPVPILDTIANGARKALAVLPKKKPVEPAPDEKQGVEAVVEVRKVEAPPEETLK